MLYDVLLPIILWCGRQAQVSYVKHYVDADRTVLKPCCGCFERGIWLCAMTPSHHFKVKAKHNLELCVNC